MSWRDVVSALCIAVALGATIFFLVFRGSPGEAARRNWREETNRRRLAREADEARRADDARRGIVRCRVCDAVVPLADQAVVRELVEAFRAQLDPAAQLPMVICDPCYDQIGGDLTRLPVQVSEPRA